MSAPQAGIDGAVACAYAMAVHSGNTELQAQILATVGGEFLAYRLALLLTVHLTGEGYDPVETLTAVAAEFGVAP